MLILIPFAFVFIGWLIFGKRENPYIRKHKSKWRNDKEYQEYLKWLSSKGGDVPLNKTHLREEEEVNREINRHINL